MEQISMIDNILEVQTRVYQTKVKQLITNSTKANKYNIETQSSNMTEQFAAAPKVVKPKNKYKEPQPDQNEEEQIKLIYNNLMWDKRVFRGNTHAALVTLKNVDATQPLRNTGNQQLVAHEPIQMEETSTNRRANIEIFTDQFVQNLTDKPPRYQYGSQTLPLPEQKVYRHVIQHKDNMSNIQTQIWDNELFDFDYGVQPLLNVLCGRTLEVSRMEVLQEEELSVMRNRQQELTLQEKAENEKIKGMYQAEEKLKQENANKLNKYKKEKEKKIKTHKRLFSRVLAKQFLSTIKFHSVQRVNLNGFFLSQLDVQLMNTIPTQFLNQTAKINKEKQEQLQNALTLAQEARSSIIKQHNFAKQVEKTRRQKIIFKRQELAREKLERKKMKAGQAEMRKFLEDERIHQEEEEQKRLAQEAAEQGGQQAAEDDQ